jgi:branched-chain amino acid transport system substrate-binding protein
VTFQKWDGKKWNVVSDWIAPDWALLRPIIEKSANAYAAEHSIPLRTEADAERVDTKPYVANK